MESSGQNYLPAAPPPNTLPSRYTFSSSLSGLLQTVWTLKQKSLLLQPGHEPQCLSYLAQPRHYV